MAPGYELPVSSPRLGDFHESRLKGSRQRVNGRNPTIGVQRENIHRRNPASMAATNLSSAANSLFRRCDKLKLVPTATHVIQLGTKNKIKHHDRGRVLIDL